MAPSGVCRRATGLRGAVAGRPAVLLVPAAADPAGRGDHHGRDHGPHRRDSHHGGPGHVPGGPDTGLGRRLGARPVRGQPAVLPPRGVQHTAAARLPDRQPGVRGRDVRRGADRGDRPVAPAARPDAGPAGPGCDHPHRAGQHDDPGPAPPGAGLPALEHRRDRARRQPSTAGGGPRRWSSCHDRQPVVSAGAPASDRGPARLRAPALVRAAGRRCGE